MNRSRTCLFVLTAGLQVACAADPPPSGTPFLNPSFEHATPLGHPLGWYIEADPRHATVRIAADRAGHGERALHVRNHGEDPVVMYTPLLAGAPCVPRIDVSAKAFTADSSVDVSLFFLEPGGAPEMGESARPGDGWAEIVASASSHSGCLPTDLLLGVSIAGRGDAWVDGVQVASDNPAYAPAQEPPIHPPPARDLSAIRRHAAELTSLEPSAAPDDLQSLHALFSAPRIVGLGENSHGARALFRLKHRLVRFLVESAGFTVFALEMPAAQAATVNDYVLGKHDDERRALLALAYPSWQSEEMWALIEWLRLHNRTAVAPVTFHGLDTPRDHRSDDQRMADESMRVLEAAPAESRMMIWADNTHVTRAGKAMGARLAERYGQRYLAIGTTFDEGRYTAYGPEQRYDAHPGYPGTHEHVLAQTGMDAFLLDLARLPQDHVLNEPRAFRYIGSMPQEFHQFYPHRLREHFDVLGFVRRTEGITFLLRHEF